jgi:hypothetical protein
MQTAKSDDLLSRAELADRLRVMPSTVGRWTRLGRIPARRLSSKVVRYDLAAVLSALDAHQQGANDREVNHAS